MNRKIFYKKTQNLTNTENYIIDTIENNPSFFRNASITQLSKKLNCSISSISKLVKKMGHRSFKEMQIWFDRELIEINQNKIFENPKQIEELASNIKINNTIVLNRTLRDLDFINLKKIKNIIKNKKVFTFGIGSSYISAFELANGFQKIGIDSKSYKDVHSIFIDINQLNKESIILFVFTNSARGKEIQIIRKVSKNNNIKLFIFTSNQSIMENENEFIVKYRTIEQEKRIIASTSKISQLFIVDIIINWIGKYKKNKIYEYFSKEWR